nr:transcriptional regulator, LysR family [Kibdelosporangium sp. MJ126-NF4]CTQ89595.1 transcriptional regulator, LysR family [Kibdelosporangium sp. MJ126-NF4]
MGCQEQDSVDITHHHLRVIIAVAEAGSIGQAAVRLRTSQAALSAKLRRIEQALGGDLFVRSRSGCVPTPFGDTVLTDARQVVDTHAGPTPPPPPREPMRVRIGGYAGVMLGEVARRLASEPWVSGVRLCDNPDSRVNVRMIANDELDLAMVYDWPPVALPTPAAVRERVIHVSEPVFVMMSQSHPLAVTPTVSLRALADYPWVDEPAGTTTWPTYLRHVCNHAGVTLHMRQVAANLPEARRLLTTTSAVAPVLATTETTSGLTIRALEGHPLRQRLRLIYRPGTPVTGRITRIIQHIGQAYAEHQGCNAPFRTWWNDEGCHTMPVR